MYTLNKVFHRGSDTTTLGIEPFLPTTVDHAAQIGRDFTKVRVIEKLEFYRQLIAEFGWSKLREVFASYHLPDNEDSLNGTLFDGFYIRYCLAVKRDLTEFFRRWNFPISKVAQSRVESLKYPLWLPPGW